MQRKNKVSFRRLADESVILTSLSRFTAWLHHLLTGGIIGRCLTAYAAENNLFEKRAIAAHFHDADRADAAKKRRRALSRSIEGSRILRLHETIAASVMTSPLSAHGMFWLLYGTLALLGYYLQMSIAASAHLSNAVFGIAAFVLSVPMMAVNRPFWKVLQDSVIMSFFARVLGIRQNVYDATDKNYYVGSVISAIVAGTVTFFVPAPMVLTAVLALMLLVTVILHPEWGVCITALLLPWVLVCDDSVLWLCVPVMLSLLGFVTKCIQGRRTLRWQILDVTVCLLAVMCLVSGVFSPGSGRTVLDAAVVFLAVSVYFLVVNLLRVSEWLERFKAFLLYSSGAAAGYFLFVRLWQEDKVSPFVASEGNRVSGVAVCFIALLLLTLTELLRKTAGQRLLMGVVGALLFLCLLTASSVPVLILLIIGAVPFFILYSKKTFCYLILITPPAAAVWIWMRALIFDDAVGHLDVLKNSLMTERAADLAATEIRMGVHRGVFAMLRDYWFSGIGLGNAAFADVYPLYAELGLAGVENACNLYLQILLEVGLPGLLLFVAMIFVLAQFLLGYLKAFSVGPSSLEIMACTAAIPVFLLAGAGAAVISSVPVLFFAMLIMGYAVATVDNDMRERRSVLSVFNDSESRVDMVLSLNV